MINNILQANPCTIPALYIVQGGYVAVFAKLAQRFATVAVLESVARPLASGNFLCKENVARTWLQNLTYVKKCCV